MLARRFRIRAKPLGRNKPRWAKRGKVPCEGDVESKAAKLDEKLVRTTCPPTAA